MAIVLAIFAVATCAWAAVFVQRGSLWIALAGFVAVGYVVGPPGFSPKIGPITLTADRILLLGLGATYLWNWRRGKLVVGAITEFDWLLLGLLTYLTFRCVTTDSPPEAGGSLAGPWWRLVASFWMPAMLYLVARTTPLDERGWKQLLAGLAALGLFLALTSWAEIGKQWWAVFPRYISDPALGTHFGRARGPALNSASLGVNLTIGFWATWLLACRLSRRWQLVAVAALVVMTGAIYFTYTRSIWIGLIACGALVPLIQLPKQWRYPLMLVGGFLAAVAVVTLGDKLTNLGRKDSDSSAEHSVYQRASFAYVSAHMFADAPILGCGLGRFYDLKLPYLSDRHQQIELESLRNLDHHNTLLSILVETGLVGELLFCGVLIAFGRAAWLLIRRYDADSWQRNQGLFSLAVLVTYLSSALFHDLTLLPSEQWILFLSAGATVGVIARQRKSPISFAAMQTLHTFSPSLAV